MAIINPTLPTPGGTDAVEEPKIVTALSSIIGAINALDSTNIQAGSIQTAALAAGAVTRAKTTGLAVTLGSQSVSGTATSGATTTLATVSFTPTVNETLFLMSYFYVTPASYASGVLTFQFFQGGTGLTSTSLLPVITVGSGGSLLGTASALAGVAQTLQLRCTVPGTIGNTTANQGQLYVFRVPV